MNRFRILAVAALATLATMALLGAGSASATRLYKYTTPSANDALGVGSTIDLTTEPGTSILIKETGGGTNDTCTGLDIHGDIIVDNGVTIRVTGLTATGCSHTSDSLKNADGTYGQLQVSNTAGTTNGTLVSKEMRITVQSTIFGISCTLNTGAGTTLGSLTGAKSSTGQAKATFNAVVSAGAFCGDWTMMGSFSVNTPLGLTVEAS
jgi:hypothetical protein